MIRLRFWRWLHGVCEHHIREVYMTTHFHDRCCPNCYRWGAVGGFDWGNIRRLDPYHDALTCQACGHEAVWFMGGMLPEVVK